MNFGINSVKIARGLQMDSRLFWWYRGTCGKVRTNAHSKIIWQPQERQWKGLTTANYIIWPDGLRREFGFFPRRNPVLLRWGHCLVYHGTIGPCPTAVWESLIVFWDFTLKKGRKRWFLMKFGIYSAKTARGLKIDSHLFLLHRPTGGKVHTEAS